MEAYLKSIESEFSLSRQKLHELTLKFQRELEIGLSKTDGMLRALPSFVFDLPKGSEVGKYLTVDLGGTNLRIGLVELLGSGRFTIKKDSAVIPDGLKCGSGKAIFDFIAKNIETFLEHPEIEAELPLKLGFTFSFPVKQESLAHGTILGWSKEIEAKDVIGMDAVALLQEALHARGLDIAVEALVNDTVGTLLAQIYRDDQTRMSVILGTGSNAAYAENCSHIPKLKDNELHSQTVINIEWGSFGDGPSNETILPITRFDHVLDMESKNNNLQRFEKMISGMYLGEIFRLILVEAIEKGFLKSIVANSDNVSIHPYGIKTKDMSRFHSEFINKNIDGCKLIIKEKFGIEIRNEFEIEMLSKLCEIISLRSCYLCAVGITAVHRHLLSQSNPEEKRLFSVALDGALYQRYPNYAKILQDLVCEMDTDGSSEDSCRVVLVMAEDLSSIGAAAAIAAQKNK